jgi:hypothetical protein
MVYTWADNIDTIVDDEPNMLPEPGLVMGESTPRPERPVPAPRPHTPEPLPQPRTPETFPITGLEYLGLRKPQKLRPAAPTLREAEAMENTLDVDGEHQQLGESAGGHRLHDIALLDVPLPETRPDDSVHVG